MKKESENQFQHVVLLGHSTSAHTALSAENSFLITSFLVFLWGSLNPPLKHRSNLCVVELNSIPRIQLSYQDRRFKTNYSCMHACRYGCTKHFLRVKAELQLDCLSSAS